MFYGGSEREPESKAFELATVDLPHFEHDSRAGISANHGTGLLLCVDLQTLMKSWQMILNKKYFYTVHTVNIPAVRLIPNRLNRL